jgi:hypothetical protein
MCAVADASVVANTAKAQAALKIVEAQQRVQVGVCVWALGCERCVRMPVRPHYAPHGLPPPFLCVARALIRAKDHI